MFPGVHDSEIVAYSVDSRSEELVFVCAPGTGSADGEFRLVFRGVLAHQFAYPQLPSIILELMEVPVEDLLAREADNLAEGARQSGWPGPWYSSTETATAHCVSAGLKGYELLESYGMSGWVIARSVERVGGP
jgi:hypothetical protein